MGWEMGGVLTLGHHDVVSEMVQMAEESIGGGGKK